MMNDDSAESIRSAPLEGGFRGKFAKCQIVIFRMKGRVRKVIASLLDCFRLIISAAAAQNGPTAVH